ncbi:MAG: radical SAM protein [Vicinamibacteria bacterium]
MIQILRRALRRPVSWAPDPILPPRPADGPLWVSLSEEQPHPIDLRWVDTLMSSARPHLMVRPEDDLLILVPNTPLKLNRTAVRMLEPMVHRGAGIADVLAREGDTPEKRAEMHAFFTDLKAWLEGRLGEGHGRRAVVQEPFTAAFCRYPVLAEVALTYRCNLTCGFCYAGCGTAGLPEGWSESRVMTDDEVCRVLDVIRHDARCPSVSFTGGEPTLRPALPRFVRHAKSLGLRVNLISNGQRLDAARVAELADAGLDSAQLSLEGRRRRVHDALVGSRAPSTSSGGASSTSARTACARPARTRPSAGRTRPSPELIVDLVADRGGERLTMNLVIPCGAAGTDASLPVRYSEAGALVQKARARAEARGVELIWYSPLPLCLFNTVAEGLGNRGCAAADGLLHVGPAGDVLRARASATPSLGNLLRQPFEEVWQSRAACRFFPREGDDADVLRRLPARGLLPGRLRPLLARDGDGGARRTSFRPAADARGFRLEPGPGGTTGRRLDLPRSPCENRALGPPRPLSITGGSHDRDEVRRRFGRR